MQDSLKMKIRFFFYWTVSLTKLKNNIIPLIILNRYLNLCFYYSVLNNLNKSALNKYTAFLNLKKKNENETKMLFLFLPPVRILVINVFHFKYKRSNVLVSFIYLIKDEALLVLSHNLVHPLLTLCIVIESRTVQVKEGI